MALIGALDVGFPLWFASNSDFTHAWLLSEDAWGRPSMVGYNRRRYKPREFATFVDTNETFEEAFTSGRSVTDIFSIAGTELSIRATFGLANRVSFAMADYLPLVPFDGVVGIANDADGGFLRSMGRQLKAKVISIWTGRLADISEPHGAFITFGGLDSSCSAEWPFVNQTVSLGHWESSKDPHNPFRSSTWKTEVRLNDWGFPFSSVTLDSADGITTEIKKNGSAVVSLSDLFIVAPWKNLKPLIQLADAKVDSENAGRFLIDCRRASSLPNVTFHIGGSRFSLAPADYVFKMKEQRDALRSVVTFSNFFTSLKYFNKFWHDWLVSLATRLAKLSMFSSKDSLADDEAKCALGFTVALERFKYDTEGNFVVDDDATWTLGAAFFSSHCVAYDWDTNKIGLAKAL